MTDNPNENQPATTDQPEASKAKGKLALYWAASCGGCLFNGGIRASEHEYVEGARRLRLVRP